MESIAKTERMMLMLLELLSFLVHKLETIIKEFFFYLRFYCRNVEGEWNREVSFGTSSRETVFQERY